MECTYIDNIAKKIASGIGILVRESAFCYILGALNYI